MYTTSQTVLYLSPYEFLNPVVAINYLAQAYFFNVLAKTQPRKKSQFLPSAQKLKAIFVQKLKVGAAFI